MTLRQFLNAGYVLLVEQYTSMGMSMLEALEKTALWREGAKPEVVGVPPQEVSDQQNMRSLAQLDKAMSGVGR